MADGGWRMATKTPSAICHRVGGGSCAASVNQPEAGKASEQAKSRSIKLMQDLAVRVIDRLLQEIREQRVELFREVEALFRARAQRRLGVHARGDRRREDRCFFIHLHAQRR